MGGVSAPHEDRESMTYRLEDVTFDGDFASLVTCFFTSFQNPPQPLLSLFCPLLTPSTPLSGLSRQQQNEAVQHVSARLQAWHKANPASRWQKVIDNATDDVVGGALWEFHSRNPFDTSPPVPAAEWWPEGPRRNYISKCVEEYEGPRQAMGQRPQVYLRALFTHPDHRRCGISRAVLQWGVMQANKMGVEMWLDALEAGLPVFIKAGFEVAEVNYIRPRAQPPVSDEWTQLDRRVQPLVLWVLWRPPNGDPSVPKPWHLLD